MPKKKPPPERITERRLTARPRWVRPRKQRTTPGRPCTRAYLRRRRDTPVQCNRDETTLQPAPHPQLIFERANPAAGWVVPAVDVPLYYFDDWMLKKKLVLFKSPDTFVVPGGVCDRVFKLVAREQVHRTFWNRYLVFEVRSDLPHNGAP